MIRTLLVSCCLCLAGAALATDFDHDAYAPVNLSEAAAQLGIDPRADLWFDVSYAKYQTVISGTGVLRPTVASFGTTD